MSGASGDRAIMDHLPPRTSTGNHRVPRPQSPPCANSPSRRASPRSTPGSCSKQLLETLEDKATTFRQFPMSGSPRSKMIIRQEATSDFAAVDQILQRAFERPAEAGLVRRIRTADPRVISLVALLDDQVTGHILFTPVSIEGHDDQTLCLGLGPMAVDPPHQRSGIGSALVNEGLAACRTAGASLVFVLGLAGYYPRFGFQLAAPAGFHYKSAKFDPYFMVIYLVRDAGSSGGGMVSYLPEFAGV